MKLIQAYHLLIFLTVTATSAPIPKYAKPGCNDTCGKMKIPYPFGIGADCAVNQWYIIDCNSSTPYLVALNHLEVLDISVYNSTVTVITPKITGCQNSVQKSSDIFGVHLGSSPFFFSGISTKFVFDGCGSAVMMDNGNALTACSTTCGNVTLSDRQSCVGIGCCQTAIPQYFNSFSVNFSAMENRACGSAFLVDESLPLYLQLRFSDPFIFMNASFIPVSLIWTLTASDQVTCCDNRTRGHFKMELFNRTLLDVSLCNYKSTSTEGTSYLIDGCKDVDNHTNSCKTCEDRGGHCRHERTIKDVPYFTCIYYTKKNRMGLGAKAGLTVLSLVLVCIMSIKCIKHCAKNTQKRNNYIRNGGKLLKKQQEVDPSLVDKTILFTSRELKKATDNFNDNRVLGSGGQGTVYKGMLLDGRIAAIKKPKRVDESQLEQFINEVVILSQINHRNVVKLLGCCLETDVPLLVYEFIPNGTLYDRLHNKTDEAPISFDMRIQIAREVAGAIAYMHSATSIPIYHRDIKTTNILLDEKYRAKVSDFGTSRFVSIGKTHLTTLVKGTFGYFDPQYFQSSQFTEKSDVYSFGVVLVELLTGEKPISDIRIGENKGLVAYFMLAMEEGHVMSIFDATVISEGTRDTLLILADLAMRCLNVNGKYRPTMKEVAMELETIRTSHISSVVQTDTDSMEYVEEVSMLTYDESSSTFVSCNDSITQ